ncbi:MAG: hypothetical protein EOR51_29990 [Mesorhizobium sp.]|nr:MAG: hypothetical protein EOR51_29990 [Mesorhizobium sp.]
MAAKKQKIADKELTALVGSLQRLVEAEPDPRDAALAGLADFKRQLHGGSEPFDLDVRSHGAEGPGIRTTCPSRTVAAAQTPKDLDASVIDFYMTRVRKDGVSETRFIGRSKYPDGDGKWRVDFTSERFGRSPKDLVFVHAEVTDTAGQILAANAVGVIA